MGFSRDTTGGLLTRPRIIVTAIQTREKGFIVIYRADVLCYFNEGYNVEA